MATPTRPSPATKPDPRSVPRSIRAARASGLFAVRSASSRSRPPRKIGTIVATGRYTPTAKARTGSLNASAASAIPTPIATSVHGSTLSRTPSMTSFISVACGAGSSAVPNPYARSSRTTVRQTKTADERMPTISPIWMRSGVPPTR